MIVLNIFLLVCIAASLLITWQTFVQHGSGFALVKFLGCMTLLYSGSSIFLGQALEARILGFLTLIPGLWLYLFK